MKSEAEMLWRRARFDRQAGADFAKAAVNMERSELPWPPVCGIMNAVIRTARKSNGKTQLKNATKPKKRLL